MSPPSPGSCSNVTSQVPIITTELNELVEKADERLRYLVTLGSQEQQKAQKFVREMMTVGDNVAHLFRGSYID